MRRMMKYFLFLVSSPVFSFYGVMSWFGLVWCMVWWWCVRMCGGVWRAVVSSDCVWLSVEYCGLCGIMSFGTLWCAVCGEAWAFV